MNSINDAFVNSLLADSAYVDLIPLNFAGDNLTAALTGRMTLDLAKYVGDNFTVVSQIGGQSSSFDATVWRGNVSTPYSGQIYVSMRGTQEGLDFLADADLASTGIAHQQLVDMVNWWLRTSTPAFTPAGAPRTVAQIRTSNGNFYSAPLAQATGELASLGTIKSVNGHSLGGYLATAFSRLFGAKWPIQTVSTFNSAGFSRPAAVNIEAGFNQIAQLIDPGIGLSRFSSAQNNYFAENGINVTTNTWDPLGFQQYGYRIGLFQEDDVQLTDLGWSNHFLYKQTDLLALGNALATLDTSFDLTRLSALSKTGSNLMAASYEGVLDGVRKLFSSATFTPTLIGDSNATNIGPQPEARRSYQANLAALKNGIAFKAIAGKVSLSTSSVSLATTARTDFASLLSLLTLSPVALKATAGNEAAVESALKPAWGIAYDAWAADKAKTQADRDAGRTHYTQRFLDDRAAMLGTLVSRNQLDTTDGVSAGGGATPIQFVDRQQNVTVHVGLSNPLTDKRQVVFGKDAADVFNGKSLADRMYGGALNDSLNGMEGADYLEGNAGNDTLDGGAGAFDDTLNGGAGADLYVVNTKAGFDTIATSEAGDRLQLGGRVLNGSGTIIPGNSGTTVWQDSSISTAPITYSFNTGSATLTIQGSGSVVLVKDFASGDLGINVPVASPAPPPPATNPVRDLSTYAAYGWRDDGFASTPAGSADRIVNFNGWHVTPESGLLTIDSRGGNDWIEGGTGLSGMALQVTAGSGNDQVYATTLQTLGAALTSQDAAVASGRSDLLLDGGVGDDSVFGGAGDDALFGGNGADTLVGGAGRDVIFSDGDSGSRFSNPSIGSKWVAGDNASGSTVYFNGAPQLGTVSYNYVGGVPNAADRHFKGNFYGVESTDLTPIGALTGRALTTSDYSAAGWTVRADGQFSGAASQVGAPDPQAALYFNTNRHSGRDVVYAGSGNDLVNAGGGDDFVDAGTGNDVVRGYQGDDQIYGGAGNDNLLGDSYAKVSLVDEKLLGVTYRKFSLDPGVAGQGHGNDYIDGGAGNDRLEGNGGSDVLFGGAGNDLAFGDDSKTSSGVFIKDEFGGNDYIDTGADNDYVEGGARSDRIFGGDGSDTLFGDNNFQDMLPTAGYLTAAGDDTLEGGLGNDYIWGEGGSDSILGGEGDDQIFGDGDYNKLRVELHGNDDLDGGWGNDTMLGGGGADTLRGGEGNDWLTGDDEESISAPGLLTGDDVLVGGNGTDTLFGGAGADQLSGGADYDWINGGKGNDLLDGGAAADFLMGGDGADTYLFGHGMGADTISNDDADAQGTNADTIQLSADVTPANIMLQSSTGNATAGHLVISSADSLDTLLVTDYFRSGGSSTSAVESLKFSDGTVWSVADVKARLLSQAASGATRAGTEGNNTLNGGTGGDRLFGFGGSDVINGLDGGDYLVGGPGADTLNGGTGDDIYRFDLGDGFDRIQEITGSGDELRFGPGISASDLTVLRSGNDVILRLLNGTDQITLSYWLDQPTDSYKVDRVQFSDGTRWSTADIASRALGLTGTSSNDLIKSETVYAESIRGLGGNDTLSAWGAGDTLDGGAGDDLLSAASSSSERRSVTFIGGTGSDTMHGSYEGDVYLFEVGDGADTINESGYSPGNTDELRFGTGIASTDMTVSRLGNDLVLKHRNGNDRITISGWFSFDGWTQQVETFRFRDITWTAAQLTAPLLTITGSAGADSLIGGDGYAETLRGLAGNDTLIGSWVGDTLEGGDGNDLLDAGTGSFNGTSYSATLAGGRGNDTLIGSTFDNLYRFDLGDGADVISDGGSLNTSLGIQYGDELRFGAGISSANVAASRSGMDLLLKHTNGTDSVTVKDWFSDAYFQIEKFTFTDATWTASQITSRILDRTGSAGADNLVASVATMPETLRGLAGNDTLTANGLDLLDGGDGNDVLQGSVGADTYIGGAGDDTLNDSDIFSDDVYVWGRTQGWDKLSDQGGNYDRIDILAGVSEDQVWLRKDGNNLELSIIGTSDRLTINNWYANTTNRIESFKLADGQALLASQVQQLVDAMAAFAPPAAGQTSLPANYQTVLNPVIAPSWA